MDNRPIEGRGLVKQLSSAVAMSCHATALLLNSLSLEVFLVS